MSDNTKNEFILMDHLVFYSSKFVLKLPVSTLLTLPHKFTGLCVQDMNMLVEANKKTTLPLCCSAVTNQSIL